MSVAEILAIACGAQVTRRSLRIYRLDVDLTETSKGQRFFAPFCLDGNPRKDVFWPTLRISNGAIQHAKTTFAVMRVPLPEKQFAVAPRAQGDYLK
jgi:hypothetical protein